MKKIRFKKSLSAILCIVLVAAIALFTVGCSDNKTETPQTDADIVSSTLEAYTVMGEGERSFVFTFTDIDGKTEGFEIHTDEEIVGEALSKLGLISGDEGPYGLYVKTVNGITVDYDKDGKYWAFYENGKIALAGVDTTKIVNGATYSFKAE